SDTAFPAGLTVSPNRDPAWTDDLDALVFGIHEPKKKDEKARDAKPAPDKKPEPAKISGENGAADDDFAYQPPRRPTPGPAGPATDRDQDKTDLVIWHWQDSRLQSTQQVQAETDKAFNYVCLYRVKDGKF